MGGTKRAKQFFQKHTNSGSKKCWEKNRRLKERKKFFIFTPISWPKNGGTKRAKQISRNTRIVREKMFGKKFSENSAKNFFLYSHEYRDQKMEEQNARKNFSRNTLIVRAKNFGKKFVGEKCEKRLFIFTRISWPKNGGKTRETIFPETQV